MRILGIDPGSVSAAHAVVVDTVGRRNPVFSAEAIGDVPVADRMVDAVGFAAIVRKYRPDLAIIERVSAMPKQGVSSTFKFGMGCGLLRGVVLACGVPLIEVPPNRWKKYFGLDNDGEKSRALAIRRFPAVAADLQRKKDHGRAEALLLALWQFERGDQVDVV